MVVRTELHHDGVVGSLVLAVLAAATASPSPLPVIITTESSPICTAVREKIAPAISRVVYEDKVMVHQHPTGRPSPQSKLPVMALALNWVKLDGLLNPDTFFHSDNPAENARMESLRERLQKIADDENNALNMLSGAMYTYEMQALASEGIVFAGQYGEAANAGPPPKIPAYAGALEQEYLRREALTQQDELAIYPELQPLISQCSH
jgi:hypothetical protein